MFGPEILAHSAVVVGVQAVNEQLQTADRLLKINKDHHDALEAKVLASFLANPVASVLSVGGGAVTEFRNRTAMDGQERVVWLRATDATLVSRVGNGADRPLLAGKDPAAKLARLSRDREPMYTEVADVVVDVDDLTLDDVVDRVVAALR